MKKCCICTFLCVKIINRFYLESEFNTDSNYIFSFVGNYDQFEKNLAEGLKQKERENEAIDRQRKHIQKFVDRYAFFHCLDVHNFLGFDTMPSVLRWFNRASSPLRVYPCWMRSCPTHS
jgi:hypothetical protein